MQQIKEEYKQRIKRLEIEIAAHISNNDKEAYKRAKNDQKVWKEALTILEETELFDIDIHKREEQIKTHIKALTIYAANNDMMNVTTCAEYLDVHPLTIRKRIKDEEIVAQMIGSQYRIPKIQFLEQIISQY